MEPGGSMPHSQGLSNNSYPVPKQSRSEALCDVSEHPCFYSVRLLASRQTLKLEDHSWSAVHDCLFNIFAANLQICRLTPPSATQGTRHAVVTGTHEWTVRYTLVWHWWTFLTNMVTMVTGAFMEKN